MGICVRERCEWGKIRVSVMKEKRTICLSVMNVWHMLCISVMYV